MTDQWFSRPPGAARRARDWRCAPVPPRVRAFHAALPGYAPTALTELPALAAELGAARVFVKDESARLGLPAFKALGATWAIHRVLAESGPAGQGTRLTLVTATDGNHGRAVARTARSLGQAAHVVVPDGVHPGAVAAIAAEGATVEQVAGSYDDAVARAAELAAADRHAVLVQDTAAPGHERVPAWIVEGYATLFAEIDDQLAAAGAPPPDLVVVPVGVGSLAQAAVAHYRADDRADDRAGSARPALLAVEPDSAAGVLASLAAGRPTSVPTGRTVMAGLNCGTPSSLAWPYLAGGLDAAVAVGDDEAMTAVRDLASLGVRAGPCGAAALAGARAALTGPEAADRRAALDLTPRATVVLLSTEGADANPYAANPYTAEPAEPAAHEENP